ncbi:MAG: TGS domain-containing protein, partial [candidate division Zixibacteria bacterium]|nr:TGS domain-containing protein [candidate division Zixibacteria bacterium]
MSKIKVTLEDRTTKEYPKGTTPFQVTEELHSGSASKWLVAKINENVVDMSYPIDEDATLEFLGFDSPAGKEVYWHSTSHVMAQAVQELFPEVKLGIGPAIDQGFYYDFDRETSFTSEELEKIEKRMQEIIKEDYPFKRIELSKESAIELFSKKGEKYKLELISEIPGDKVTLYQSNSFVDLCRGPHLPSTGRIKAFKLLSIAGAYWRGKERNPMLQRIYGTSYPEQKQLDEHVNWMEEIKKRDHRRLGKE